MCASSVRPPRRKRLLSRPIRELKPPARIQISKRRMLTGDIDKCGVSEIAIHSLRSNWPGARREGGSASPAILDRLSNEAPGQFQRNPEGGPSFGRRRCCSLLTVPLRDMLWCPCGSTSRLAYAQNPLPRMYSYFGDTTPARQAGLT